MFWFLFVISCRCFPFLFFFFFFNDTATTEIYTLSLHDALPISNPRYHALISAFRDLTGVPLVLNTSFNDNEPIVCRPEEALDCFLRTQMDALVLGDFLITKS